MTRYQLARWAPVVGAVAMAVATVIALSGRHWVWAGFAVVAAVCLAGQIPAARRSARAHEARERYQADQS